MKFEIFAGKLKPAFDFASKVIDKKSTALAWANLFFRVQGNDLYLVGRNWDTIAKVKLKVNGIEDGLLGIEPRRLLTLLKSLSDATALEFSTEKDRLIVKTEEGNEYGIAGWLDEETPDDTDVKTGNEFVIKSDTLKKLIDSVIYAVSKERTGKPALEGVYFEFQHSGIEAVASDGYRMARAHWGVNDPDQSFGVIFNPTALKILSQTLEGDWCKVIINDTRRWAKFIWGENHEYELITMLIDEKYPDYRKIFDNAGKKTAVVDRNEFLSALKRVAKFTNKDNGGVMLDFNGDYLTIYAGSETEGAGREKIKASVDFDRGLKVMINAKLLIEAVDKFRGNYLKLGLDAPDRPVFLWAVDSLDEIIVEAVVMPMRIS